MENLPAWKAIYVKIIDMAGAACRRLISFEEFIEFVQKRVRSPAVPTVYLHEVDNSATALCVLPNSLCSAPVAHST